MNITFVVPLLNLSGGLRVVAIYSRMLAEKGHNVTVVSPNRKQPKLKEKIKALIGYQGYQFKNNFDPSFFENPSMNLKILEKYRPVTANDVPDGDIVVATFWNTAEWVADFPPSKGKKVYFVQHYEVHPWIPSERIKMTLKLDFRKIAVAEWIADVLAQEYGDPDVAVVSNGVDTEQFKSPERDKQQNPTVGTMYSSKTFKGFDVALSAFERAKKSIPDLKFTIFGAEKIDFTLPEGCSYHLKPPQKELNHLYGSCDAWLFTSQYEGFGLPILEAMSCRTPVIGTRAGAAPDLVDQSNGFLLDIDDVEGISDSIIKVAKMSNNEWRALSNKAYETALNNTWDKSVDKFEKTLINLAQA